tara:strand:+ start:51 stop:260 length:210 start_codon:yes stop_codon:yes gene_type:complete
MNLNQKLLILKKNNKKKQNYLLNKVFDNLKEIKSCKSLNPTKGQIFVFSDSNEEYYFFQFNGKKWIHIE